MRITSALIDPALLDLPWSIPLEDWPADHLVALPQGISRHIVRFVKLNDVVSALKRKRPEARAIVLTGYGNIATAVTAVKMGAVDYLSKPADAYDVIAALLATGTEKSELPANPMSADRVRWEHIQRIYEMCNRNVSETARRLNMHRRTLQRILAKRAPR